MAPRLRKRILLGILLLFIALSASIRIYDFIHFVSLDPWVLSDENGLKRRLYGNEYSLIEKGSELPADSRILVLGEYWIANYYLYPRRLFYFDSQGHDKQDLLKFIAEHEISYIAVNEGNETKIFAAGSPP